MRLPRVPGAQELVRPLMVPGAKEPVRPFLGLLGWEEARAP